jgi:hypothetical protein
MSFEVIRVPRDAPASTKDREVKKFDRIDGAYEHLLSSIKSASLEGRSEKTGENWKYSIRDTDRNVQMDLTT